MYINYYINVRNKENHNEKEEIRDSSNDTIYNKLKVPGSIKISEYYYVFKEQLKSNENIFTYRCKKFKFRVIMHISRNNLEKIENKNNNEKMEFTLLKDHKCKSEGDKSISEKPENCDTDKEIIKKAKEIILANPLSPLSYQKSKLNNSNIFLEDTKINNLITNLEIIFIQKMMNF